MRIINITVKPNFPKTKIISQNKDNFVMAVAAPAEQNKANIELVKFLRKHFNVDVEIIRGLKSKNKIVRLQ